jgi:hypothetical protein
MMIKAASTFPLSFAETVERFHNVSLTPAFCLDTNGLRSEVVRAVPLDKQEKRAG